MNDVEKTLEQLVAKPGEKITPLSEISEMEPNQDCIEKLKMIQSEICANDIPALIEKWATDNDERPWVLDCTVDYIMGNPQLVGRSVSISKEQIEELRQHAGELYNFKLVMTKERKLSEEEDKDVQY